MERPWHIGAPLVGKGLTAKGTTTGTVKPAYTSYPGRGTSISGHCKQVVDLISAETVQLGL